MSEEPNESAPPKNNGRLAILNTLAATGDTWVKIATLALVAITGGGNFLATTKSSEFNASEINTAIKEIDTIHDALVTTMERQKDMYNLVRDIDRRTARQSGHYQPPTPAPSPQ